VKIRDVVGSVNIIIQFLLQLSKFFSQTSEQTHEQAASSRKLTGWIYFLEFPAMTHRLIHYAVNGIPQNRTADIDKDIVDIHISSGKIFQYFYCRYGYQWYNDNFLQPPSVIRKRNYGQKAKRNSSGCRPARPY